MEGALIKNLAKRARKMAQIAGKLGPEEEAVLKFLRSRLEVAKSRKSAEARTKALAPKTVKDALRRSLKLVSQQRKAS
jgi:hypothetical protein